MGWPIYTLGHKDQKMGQPRSWSQRTGFAAVTFVVVVVVVVEVSFGCPGVCAEMGQMEKWVETQMRKTKSKSRFALANPLHIHLHRYIRIN